MLVKKKTSKKGKKKKKEMEFNERRRFEILPFHIQVHNSFPIPLIGEFFTIVSFPILLIGEFFTIVSH